MSRKRKSNEADEHAHCEASSSSSLTSSSLSSSSDTSSSSSSSAAAGATTAAVAVPPLDLFSEEAFERSRHPETWTNHGDALYRERYGPTWYNNRIRAQFPKAPMMSVVERMGLDSQIKKIQALMTTASMLGKKRPTHTRGIAGVGEATVLANPAIPANKFFLPYRKFLVRMRHSNALGTFTHDGGFEPRGCAIKFADSVNAAPFDLFLNTGETMGFFNLDTFMEFTTSQISGSDVEQSKFVRNYPSALSAAIGGYRRAPNSYHDLHYYSQIALDFIADDGKKRICKFRAVPYGNGPFTPVLPEQSGLPDLRDQRNCSRFHLKSFGEPREDVAGRSPLYLQEEFIERVRNGEGLYRLQIQFREVLQNSSHHIYNGNVAWDANEFPFHDLMVIDLHGVLQANETEQMTYHLDTLPEDTLKLLPAYASFDYNSIAVCRAAIYPASQAVRLLNDKSPETPTPAFAIPVTGTSTKSIEKIAGGESHVGGSIPKCCEYGVTTYTGDHMFSGTDHPIGIAIMGAKGAITGEGGIGTTSTNVLNDNRLTTLNRFAKDKFSFYDVDVGEPLVVRLERLEPGAECWRVKYVVVTYKGVDYEFRSFGWVQGTVYLLRIDWGVLDNRNGPSAESLLRKHALIANQTDWVWNDDPTNMLPRHGSITDMSKLPAGLVPIERLLSFGLTVTEGTINSIFAGIYRAIDTIMPSRHPSYDADVHKCDSIIVYPSDRIPPEGRIHSIPDFRRSDLFVIKNCPERASRWRSNIEFADRMINGTNPLCIRGISEIPLKCNVTSRMVQHLMPEGVTLESQLAQGLVYYIDHGPPLKDIKLWTPERAAEIRLKNPEQYLDPTQRFAPPAQGLFHVHPNINGKRRLMPLAIQLLEGSDAYVFTPKTLIESNPSIPHDFDWIIAKTFFMVAHSQVHQMNIHLFSTHLIMEPFAVALERQLPFVHPVRKLLHHHVVGTVAINTFGRAVLIADGGLADRCMSIGGGGHMQMMFDFYEYGLEGRGVGNGLKFYERYNHLRFCHARRVNDATRLPNYRYRDDGAMMWDSIETYVRNFLKLHYEDDEAVKHDPELQAWIRDLHDEAFRGRLPDFLSAFNTLEEVVELVTIVIFQLSCGHASVNFSQWDEYAHLPTCPTAALKPPPTGPAQWNFGDFLDMMPSIAMIRQQIETANALSSFNAADVYIGAAYPDDIFTEEENKVVAEFKESMKVIDQILKAKNEVVKRHLERTGERLQASGDIYIYLLPSMVPNSIAV